VRVLLTSTDISLVQSAQIALEAQGIDSVLSDDNLAGLPSSPMTITVRNDADLERARVILQGLQRTPRPPWWESSWAARGLLIVVIVMVAVLCGIMIF
jgi:hypothetical protein